MAGDAVIGALRVVLGLDTGSFEDGAKKAQHGMQSFASQVAAIFSGVGLERIVERAFEAISHHFKELVASSFELADQLNKMSQKVGVPVEELSKLRIAAELSDVSMESLSKGLGTLSKNMLEAVKGTGDARQRFQDLGISVTDAQGKMRPVSDVLTDLSDKFEGSNDGAVKTATALNLLGKAGKDLIPLLNQGSTSLKELGAIAEKWGLVISKDTAEQAEKFKDNLKLLGKTAEGFTNIIVAGILPALVRWSNAYVDLAKDSDYVRESANAVVDSIKSIVAAVAYGSSIMESLTLAVQYFGYATNSLKTLDLKEANEALTLGLKALNEAFDDASKAAEKAKEAFAPLKVEVHKLKGEMDIGETPLSKEIDKLTLQALTLQGQFNQLPTGFAALAAQLKLTAENGTALATSWAGLTEQQKTLAASLLAVQAAQTAFDQMTPFEKLNLALQQLQLQYQYTDMSAQTFYAAQGLLIAKFNKQVADSYASIVGSVGDAVASLAGENKKAVAAAQALHAASALISSFAAAAQVLADPSLPFIAKLAASAAVLAKGVALVAAIKGVGFAQGGSFKVGGAGGIDSQMVQFMATPGEMVDVRKPGTTGPTPVNVTIRGDTISKDQVRTLFDTINQGMRDGYRLQLAT